MIVFKTSHFRIMKETSFELTNHKHFPVIVRRVDGLGEDILFNQITRQKFWYELNVVPADWNKVHIITELEKQFGDTVGIISMTGESK